MGVPPLNGKSAMLFQKKISLKVWDCKRTTPVCLKYYILLQIYLRTPLMRILIFQVDCLKCAIHSSWIFDTFVCFSEPCFSDKGGKTLHVSGADGWYQFIYQYLWGRMSKILGAQKFFAEWYNQMSDPILVKPILGLRPPPFLQVIWEKLYLRAFYVLKTTFSKILSFRWLHLP